MAAVALVLWSMPVHGSSEFQFRIVAGVDSGDSEVLNYCRDAADTYAPPDSCWLTKSILGYDGANAAYIATAGRPVTCEVTGSLGPSEIHVHPADGDGIIVHAHEGAHIHGSCLI